MSSNKALPRASRVTRIARWIAQQINPLVTDLQLEIETDSDNADRIASWKRGPKFDPVAVAQEVEDTLSGILAEQESKIHAKLVWITDDGVRWTTFPIKIEPEGGAQHFDGSARNLLIQQQRHLEGMALTYAKATESSLASRDQVEQAYVRAMDVLTRLIESRENRAADIELELARLRDENSQLQATLMQTESLAEQAVENAETVADELKQKRESESTDGAMLKLLSQVATKAAAAPQTPPKTGS